MAHSNAASTPGSRDEPVLVPDNAGAVLEELGRVLESRHFSGSKQGKRFLRHIVETTLKGNASLLKERLIGTALFARAPDYATGEDAVVRVEANDVRRRLEAYRAESTSQSPIVIELPVGSYVPVFRKAYKQEASAAAPVPSLISPDSDIDAVFEGAHASVREPGHSVYGSSNPVPPEAIEQIRRTWVWPLCLILALLGVCCVVFALVHKWRNGDSGSLPERLTQAFWEPVLSSPNPVVICLGKAVVYRPSDVLFDRYIKSHPREFVTDNERLTLALPLISSDSVRWGDMQQAPNYGFSIGTVRSAINLEGYFAQQRKAVEVRLGVESSFAELRHSPAVLVGAFNNRWTMELNSDLHFRFVENQRFVEDSTQLSIREQAPSNRLWTCRFNSSGAIERDYGLVTREIDWKTGQAVVSVAGIGDGGTEAATELVTKAEELGPILKSLPSNWEEKNIQLIISTDMTDGEAGSPKLIAYYLW